MEIVKLIVAICSLGIAFLSFRLSELALHENTKNNFKNMFFRLLELLSNVIQSSDVNIDDTLEKLRTEAETQLKNKKVREFTNKQEECIQLLLDLENIKLKIDGKDWLTFNTMERELNKQGKSMLNTLETKLLFIAYTKRTEQTFNMDYSEYKKEADYWKSILKMNDQQKASINKNYEDIFSVNIDLTLKEKKRVVNDTVGLNQNKKFLETINNIIMLIINDQKSIQKESALYIKILRTQLSERQLILLYYIAEYTEYGQKFKQNVRDMNLWGEMSDLNFEKSTYFNQGLLVWSKDLGILKNKYTSK